METNISATRMSSNKETVFRLVPEGTGGTFTFSNSQSESSSTSNEGLNHIEYIGTHGCYTCVGVYLKIDQSRAWCAHVNGCSRVYLPANIIADTSGETMKDEFLHRLQKEADNDKWDAINEDFGKDLVVVCPKLDYECRNGEIYKRTGWYIIQGLREFLESEALKIEKSTTTDRITNHLGGRAEFLHQLSKDLSADQNAQGFVVHHPTGEAKLFKVVDIIKLITNEIPEDLDGFVARQEQDLDTVRKDKWTMATPLNGDPNSMLAECILARHDDFRSHPPQQTDYRFVPEGCGGTFTLDPNASEVDNWNHLGHIGVHVFDECVGIYFKVDSHRAFCADIKTENVVRHPRNLIAKSEMNALKMMVFHRIVSHGEAEGWDIKDPNFGQNLILVGPKISNIEIKGTNHDRTGRCVRSVAKLLFAYVKEGLELEAMHKQKYANEAVLEALNHERYEHSGSLIFLNKGHELEHEARSILRKKNDLERRIEYSTLPKVCHGLIVQHSTGYTQLLRTTELAEEEGDIVRFKV